MKDKFPNAIEYPSELAMEFLKRRQYRKSIDEYKKITERWPNKAMKEKFFFGVALYLSKTVNTTDQTGLQYSDLCIFMLLIRKISTLGVKITFPEIPT